MKMTSTKYTRKKQSESLDWVGVCQGLRRLTYYLFFKIFYNLPYIMTPWFVGILFSLPPFPSGFRFWCVSFVPSLTWGPSPLGFLISFACFPGHNCPCLLISFFSEPLLFLLLHPALEHPSLLIYVKATQMKTLSLML